VSALYVYGFTRAGEPGRISAPDVSGESEVETMEVGKVAAVISPVSVEEFTGPEGEEPTQDLKWVAPRAIRHEEVIEEVMRAAPMLPLTFGVIFSSPSALTKAVRSHQDEITEFLDYVANKEEWQVKVYAHPAKLQKYLARTPEHRERLRNLPGSPGARYFQEKRLDRELEKRSGKEGHHLAEEIRYELRPLAEKAKSLRLLSRQASRRQDADMVLNCAFLLCSDQVERFADKVEEISRAYKEQGLTVESTGPWPPYAFGPSLVEEEI
jgi:hypothetical protein